MVNEKLERLRNELEHRLKVYDVVEDLGDAKEQWENIIKELDGCNEGKYIKDSEKHVYSVLNQIFPAGGTVQDVAGVFMSPHSSFRYKNMRIPKPIEELYQQALDSLRLLCQKSWCLYAKDVLRAVAYHTCLKNIVLKENDFSETIPMYDKKEFLNLPIDLEFQIDDKKMWYIGQSIGGGIFEKIHRGNKNNDWNFRFIFKKEKLEFDSTGYFAKDKEKGLGYDNLKKAVKELTSQALTAADIWFIKNVLDLELITATDFIKSKGNLRRDDYKLLWILCGCKCPSIRLYLFEAIKHCYTYVRNYIKPNQDYIEFIMDDLECIVRAINENFQTMASVANFYICEYSKDEALIDNCNDRFNRAFDKGDDFLFIMSGSGYMISHVEPDIKNVIPLKKKIGEVQEPSEDTGQMEKKSTHKYYEYLPVGKNDTGKIAYGVITGLNEQWHMPKDIKQMEDYSSAVVFQEDFANRLLSYVWSYM